MENKDYKDGSLVICLLPKWENQSLDLQKPCRCQVGVAATSNTYGSRDKEFSQGELASKTSHIANLSVMTERPCLSQ